MDNELKENIIENLPRENFNCVEFPVVVDGIKYNYIEVEELTTEDEGKYQYGGTIYGIGIHDEEKGYGIIGEVLFCVEQDFSQTGSYYGDQEREYNKPYLVEKKEVTTYQWKRVK